MNNSQNIRITKQFHFEAAHVLSGYDGKCKNIHGHNYALYVTLVGKPIEDKNNPKYGMVIDFSELKDIIDDLIVEPFDHSLLLLQDSQIHKSFTDNKMITKIIALPYQPTCENMVSDFANKIKAKLPKGIKLHSLKLQETPSAYAEWYAFDNPENETLIN